MTGANVKIIRLKNHRLTRVALMAAVAVLRAGGVVAYPTDTAYGLAADPTSRKGIAKIYAIKGREKGKPLPLIAGSFAQATAHVRLSGRILSLARRHWPGPLTVVSKLISLKAYELISFTAAVRVPKSFLARELAIALGRPVTSTSANRSGRPAPYSGAAVRKEFADRPVRPDLLLDVGPLPLRPVSTIVRLRRGKIEVLRKGAISL